MEQVETSNIEVSSLGQTYSIRRSIYSVFIRVLVLEFVIAVLFIIVQVISFSIGRAIGNPTTDLSVSLAVLGLLQVANTVYLIFLIAQWMNDQYIITPDEVIIKKGIYSKGEHAIQFDTIKSADIQQNIFSRQLGYGTIILRSIIGSNPIFLEDVPEPQKYIHLFDPEVRQKEKLKTEIEGKINQEKKLPTEKELNRLSQPKDQVLKDEEKKKNEPLAKPPAVEKAIKKVGKVTQKITDSTKKPEEEKEALDSKSEKQVEKIVEEKVKEILEQDTEQNSNGEITIKI